MDGNGRWATARGLPRVAGHRRGVEAVRRVVEAAPRLGIGTLTPLRLLRRQLEAPAREVAALMRLFGAFLRAERERRCVRAGVRLSRHRPARPAAAPGCVAAIGDAERATARGARLHLRIADRLLGARRDRSRPPRQRSADGRRARRSRRRSAAAYGRDGEAARRRSADPHRRRAAAERLPALGDARTPSSSSRRGMWPDFAVAELAAAIDEFHSRERRFGGLPLSVVCS